MKRGKRLAAALVVSFSAGISASAGTAGAQSSPSTSPLLLADPGDALMCPTEDAFNSFLWASEAYFSALIDSFDLEVSIAAGSSGSSGGQCPLLGEDDIFAISGDAFLASAANSQNGTQVPNQAELEAKLAELRAERSAILDKIRAIDLEVPKAQSDVSKFSRWVMVCPPYAGYLGADALSGSRFLSKVPKWKADLQKKSDDLLCEIQKIKKLLPKPKPDDNAFMRR